MSSTTHSFDAESRNTLRTYRTGPSRIPSTTRTVASVVAAMLFAMDAHAADFSSTHPPMTHARPPEWNLRAPQEIYCVDRLGRDRAPEERPE
jgi:hypothetical protein